MSKRKQLLSNMTIAPRPISHLALADWFEENNMVVVFVQEWLRAGCPSKGCRTYWGDVVRRGEKSLVAQLILEHQYSDRCRSYAFPEFYLRFKEHVEEVIKGIDMKPSFHPVDY